MFSKAITRKPGKNFADGLTTSQAGKPDFELMKKQHTAYINTLESLGLEVIILPEEIEYPDAYFVEDTAVVFEEAAIITNPGADERKGEEKTIEPVLSEYRKIEHIQAPGTVDGGDVLQIGKDFYIGLTDRTNTEGADQFAAITSKYGYTTYKVPVAEGLHLKSSVNYIGRDTLLVTEPFRDNEIFSKYTRLVLKKEEEYAANTLLINNTLITPSGFPDTLSKIESLGLDIIVLDMSEVQKMDGGLTCMSLRF